MKRCPKCNTVYDDTKNFCIKDGTQLVEVSSSTVGKGERKADVKPRRRNVKNDRSLLKKTLIGLGIVVVAIYAICNWTENAATYIRLSPESKIFTRDSQDFTIEVETDGIVWEVIHHPDWVVISNPDVENKMLEIYVQSNKGGEDREGTIEVKSGKQTCTMQVGQWAKAKKLECDKSVLTFKKKPGNQWQSITIKTDVSNLDISQPDWVEVEDIINGFKVTCEDNDGYARTGYILFRADDLSVSITVRQQGKCMACNGTGEVTSSSTRICTECTNGYIYYGFNQKIRCPNCFGKGSYTEHSSYKCTYCDGTGISKIY